MISVCMPTYNGSKYILEQLKSIIPQLKSEDEIIISDDESTDNTIELIRELNDPHVKIFRDGKFSSYIFNFENAIKRSKGDVIFLCDQDDVWLPNKVKIMTEALFKNNLVISDCYVVNSDLEIISESYFSIRKTKKNKYISLLGASPYLGCCMAFNRIILDQVLPFPPKLDHYNSSHDTWIGNVASFHYSVEFINEKLIYYRRHDNNISTFAGMSRTSLLEKINKRIYIIKFLLFLKYNLKQ